VIGFCALKVLRGVQVLPGTAAGLTVVRVRDVVVTCCAIIKHQIAVNLKDKIGKEITCAEAKSLRGHDQNFQSALGPLKNLVS
jgi:hypothetical protein